MAKGQALCFELWIETYPQARPLLLVFTCFAFVLKLVFGGLKASADAAYSGSSTTHSGSSTTHSGSIDNTFRVYRQHIPGLATTDPGLYPQILDNSTCFDVVDVYTTRMATELSPELLVTQSNRLIESAHTMSVGEKRLLMAAAALMDSRKPSAGTVSFHARQFAEVFATDLDHAYEIVRDAAKRLFNRSIREIVDDPAAKRRKGGRAAQTIRDTRWVSQAEYAEGQGVITLTFTDKVLPYLTLLHREFTSYRLKHVGRLSTFYALRMYELLSQYRVTAERTCDLAQLRQMLDLGDKYPRVNSFRQRVLDPSIQEINQVTDLLVTVTPITQGRAVTGFHFAIVTNPQLKLDLHEPLEPISADDAESDKYEQQAQQRLE